MKTQKSVRAALIVLISLAISGFGSFSSTKSVYIPLTSTVTSKSLSANNLDIMSISPLGDFYSEVNTGSSNINIRSFKPNKDPDENEIKAYVNENYNEHPADVKERLFNILVKTKEAEKYLRNQTVNFVATDEEVMANGKEWARVLKNAYEMEKEISLGRNIEENLQNMEHYLDNTLSGSLLEN